MVNITNLFFHAYSTYSPQILHEGFILKQWCNLAWKNKIRSCTTEMQEEEYSSMGKVYWYGKDTAPFISLRVSYSFAQVIWMLEAPKWLRAPENNQAPHLGHGLKIVSGTWVHVKIFQPQLFLFTLDHFLSLTIAKGLTIYGGSILYNNEYL